jgi:hypothetical protein
MQNVNTDIRMATNSTQAAQIAAALGANMRQRMH